MLEIINTIIWLFATNDGGTLPAAPHDRHLYPNY
jgi:hypothetical protein